MAGNCTSCGHNRTDHAFFSTADGRLGAPAPLCLAPYRPGDTALIDHQCECEGFQSAAAARATCTRLRRADARRSLAQLPTRVGMETRMMDKYARLRAAVLDYARALERYGTLGREAVKSGQLDQLWAAVLKAAAPEPEEEETTA